MRSMIVPLVLAGVLAHAAFSGTEATRHANFAALHGDRGFVTGQVGAQTVEMFVGHDRVTGVSTAGRVNVLVTGAVVTGTVGNARVLLTGPANVLQGTGPRGRVRLATAGWAISGFSGPHVVNMQWSHGWLEGTIGAAPVRLYTGPLANTVVAALLVALL